MNTQLALGLAAAPPSNTVVINARCTLRAEEDQRVILVGGLAVYHYCAADAVAEAYAIVMLVERVCATIGSGARIRHLRTYDAPTPGAMRAGWDGGAGPP